jgi:protein involved in ribonucleotide reduction
VLITPTYGAGTRARTDRRADHGIDHQTDGRNHDGIAHPSGANSQLAARPGTVPQPVVQFLGDVTNRAWLRGVIGAGNTNFGAAYGLAADLIAAKCQVPCLAKFELIGTPADVERIQRGLTEWWEQQ